MPVPVSQMWTVASYVVGQRLRGRRRYPLVLMLEPLFRCNLACAGCGKIQYPAHVLKRQLSVEECLKAVDECGAPMVSIPGGDLEKGKVAFEVDLASVWEKAEALANHLRTADFFDVDKFVKATITIDGAMKGEGDDYVALAIVDLHGTTSEVPVQFTVTSTDPLKITGSAVLSRGAFAIGQPHDPANERSISDEVEIELSATLPQ